MFSYQLGLFNGIADGANAESDNSDGKDFSARVFFHPFKPSRNEWANDLGVGVAGSIGDQTGTAAASNLPSFRSQAQLTFFTYAAGTFADGKRTRGAASLLVRRATRHSE